MKKTLLLHSCCGPCSTSVIERLIDDYAITVLYYNPNIEPKNEYIKRKEEQIKFINLYSKKNKVSFMDIDYDNDKFKSVISGLEDEKEGGKRCSKCIKLRMVKTAALADLHKFDYFGTTLTVSPHKDAKLINKIGLDLEKIFKRNYLVADFKKKDGYKRSIELSKEYDLYRQNYCGCSYSLKGN